MKIRCPKCNSEWLTPLEVISTSDYPTYRCQTCEHVFDGGDVVEDVVSEAQWEYKTVEVSDAHHLVPFDLDDELNKAGREGWELVSTESFYNGISIVVLFFKRQKR